MTDEELDSRQETRLCFALVAPGGAAGEQTATSYRHHSNTSSFDVMYNTFVRNAGQALRLSEAQAHLPYAILPQNGVCTPQRYKPACCSTETA